MHEYYFKIRKGDIEFEFSTNDKFTFEQQLSDWINGVVRGDYVEPPKKEIEEDNNNQTNANEDEKPFLPEDQEQQETTHQRSGFLNVKALTSINDINTPTFDFSDTKEETIAEINFEQTLAESIENPKTEVVEKKEITSDFQEYLNSYNPQNDIDKLIIAGLYTLNVENKERFTIKQLNSKLVPTTGEPIDHKTIDEAIKQNLVKIVPDLTGTNEFTEYTLTEDGENYFIN